MILAWLRGLAVPLHPGQNRFASICNGF